MTINKEIIRLAIPNILSNISIPLLSSFDTGLMGRLSETHIGAVGISAMIFNFIYWNFGFLRMGTTGITAQAYGQENKQLIANTFARAILIALLISACLLLLQTPLVELGIYLMNVPIEQIEIVKHYFYIRIWAAPATLMAYAYMGWFFGLQNVIYPLLLTIAINIVNMTISYYLVYYYGMEAEGVAYGTLIAQYAGLLLASALIVYRYSSQISAIQFSFIVQWESLLSFLQINSDIFLRTVLLTLSFALFYSQSAHQGETLLAVNIILLNFVNWMSYGIDGFAFAAESLVGKYKGAKDDYSLREAIQLSFIWGGIVAFCFSVLFFFKGTFLLSLFTDQQHLIIEATSYLYVMAAFPIFSAACYIWDGIYVGLTASKAMRNTMFIAFIGYLVLLYTLPHSYANYGLWYALITFMTLRGIFQFVFYKLDWME